MILGKAHRGGKAIWTRGNDDGNMGLFAESLPEID